MSMKKKEQGPVEILCQEIGATYTNNMESTSILVTFISVLVDEIDCMVLMDHHIADLTGKEVPNETYGAIEIVRKLLTISDRVLLIEGASRAHDTVTVHDEGPCNHYVDMLSSCVSAIRFGLEAPCRSRHAAEAASHVWKQKYGITLFDKHSPAWGRQWACVKFYEALGIAAETNQ